MSWFEERQEKYRIDIITWNCIKISNQYKKTENSHIKYYRLDTHIILILNYQSRPITVPHIQPEGKVSAKSNYREINKPSDNIAQQQRESLESRPMQNRVDSSFSREIHIIRSSREFLSMHIWDLWWSRTNSIRLVVIQAALKEDEDYASEKFQFQVLLLQPVGNWEKDFD